MNKDPRRYAPATARNREPILEVLQRFVARVRSDVVLEIASGSGEHAIFLAPRLGVTWQPSDPDPEGRASIDAHASSPAVASECKSAGATILPSLDIDVTQPSWGPAGGGNGVNLIACINMIHISPWRACEGLLDGAERLNAPLLYLYGPYKRAGRHTAPSNEAFDMSLRSRNPEWGVRDLDEVARAAATRHFDLVEVIEMPANNLSVLFKRNG